MSEIYLITNRLGQPVAAFEDYDHAERECAAMMRAADDADLGSDALFTVECLPVRADTDDGVQA